MEYHRKDRTLVLDQNYQPVMVVSWQKAFCLIFNSKAKVIRENDSQLIRSVNKSFRFPSVIVLDGYQNTHAYKRVSLNRWTVFARDNFSCTYCGKQYHKKQLSLDHIIPVSKGGKNDWLNLITACLDCNQKKANKSIAEVGFKMHFKPYRPMWTIELLLKMYQINNIDSDWSDFIYLK